MKLEEGMYVRTEWGINKINEYVPQSGQLYLKNDVCVKSNVIKASNNIIDLIEIGDVVELFMEDDIDKEDTNIFEIIAITTDKKEIGVFGKDLELEFIPIENIRKICTKEQFESMSYKVEG